MAKIKVMHYAAWRYLFPFISFSYKSLIVLNLLKLWKRVVGYPNQLQRKQTVYEKRRLSQNTGRFRFQNHFWKNGEFFFK